MLVQALQSKTIVKGFDELMLWESKIELGEKFFNEIIRHPMPLDMNILKCRSYHGTGMETGGSRTRSWVVVRSAPYTRLMSFSYIKAFSRRYGPLKQSLRLQKKCMTGVLGYISIFMQRNVIYCEHFKAL